MKRTVLALALFVTTVCAAQQMDEKNDAAMQVTLYTPHHISIARERQGTDKLQTVWVVLPVIAERFDHANKWYGLVIELRGTKQVQSTGGGGLVFTVDGKQLTVGPEIMAHSHPNLSCALLRCTATWTIVPQTAVEEGAMAKFVSVVADGHEVFATLLPANTGAGQRFSTKLTDEQLEGFHEVRQYYDSLVLTKKVTQTAAQ